MTDTPGTDVPAFTEAQATAMQKSIDGAVNAIFGKVKGLLEQQQQQVETRIKGLTPKPPDDPGTGEGGSKPGGQNDDRILELQRQIKKSETVAAELRAQVEKSELARKSELTNRVLMQALGEANAVSPADALAVLRANHEVRVQDDGQVRIVDPDGIPQPPGEFLGAFLKSRPHLLKPVSGKGPGAIGSQTIEGGKPLTKAAIEGMTDAEVSALLAKGITVGADSVFGRELTFRASPTDPQLAARRKEMGVNVP